MKQTSTTLGAFYVDIATLTGAQPLPLHAPPPPSHARIWRRIPLPPAVRGCGEQAVSLTIPQPHNYIDLLHKYPLLMILDDSQYSLLWEYTGNGMDRQFPVGFILIP
ncbi:hypothetical protein C8J57DRAFT_1526187 [Mycena rebaudengoi]|nr:hypothetical protein C8J57DRAFT_1526187 [Mycena rebaudengoi]